MRTVYAVVAALGIVVGIGPVVWAADCVIPAFLVTGKTYQIAFGFGAGLKNANVVEFDRQSCWIKVTEQKEGEFW